MRRRVNMEKGFEEIGKKGQKGTRTILLFYINYYFRSIKEYLN